MQTMPGFVQMPITGLQHTNPGAHCASPHVSAFTHRPPQSAPPAVGSQSSLGSSTQLSPAGHGKPAMPPQNAGGGGSTQMPPQSAPPALGSQPSFGSSIQLCPSGQGMLANPPQNVGSGSHSPLLAMLTPAAAASQSLP